MFPVAGVLPLLGGLGLMSRKGGGGGDGGAGAAAQMQARLAQSLVEQTDPLRTALLQRSQGFLRGGIDNSPTFAAFKAGAEPEFANARNQIIANTPAGGGLTAALAQLESGRAQGLTQARGAIDETELARAMTLATGATGQAMSGLGQAASVQAMLAQASADRDAGLLGALGTGAGAFFGSKV